MKKILILLFIILATLFAADRIGMYLFNRFIFSQTLSGENGGSVNFLLQRKKGAELIIMGSSRAKHHIDPKSLSEIAPENKIYNAGINGTGGLIYNNRLLHILLEKGFHPHTIILQLDAYPYFTMPDDKALAELAQLYPFLEESASLRKYIDEHGGYAEKIKLFLHSYRYNGKLLNILYNFRRRHAVADNTGFEGLHGSLQDSAVQPIPAGLVDPASFPALKMAALADFARTCLTNHIRLIVVFPPSYHNGLFTREGTGALADVLHKEGIKDIVDLSDSSRIPFLQQARFWRDATHLNSEGARIFSDSLHAVLLQH